jgi:hypothetical protein
MLLLFMVVQLDQMAAQAAALGLVKEEVLTNLIILIGQNMEIQVVMVLVIAAKLIMELAVAAVVLAVLLLMVLQKVLMFVLVVMEE